MTIFERTPLGKPRMHALPALPANMLPQDAAKFTPPVPAAPYQTEILTGRPVYLSWNGYTFDGERRLLDFSFNPHTSKGISKKILRKTRRQSAVFGLIPIRYDERYLVADRSTRAFYHWMIEALPKVFLVGEEGKEGAFLLPAAYREIDYVWRALKLIGDPKVDYVPRLCMARVAAGHLVTPTAPLEQGLLYYDGELLGAMARRMIDALTDDASAVGETGEKLFISRAKAARRHIVNEAEVTALLEAAGFTTVHFEDHDLDAQIRIMKQARVVVSQHGAGLSNTIFMPPGGMVVEITGKHIGDIFYFQLARALGHDYLYINGDAGGEPALDQHADVTVPIEALQTVLRMI